MSQTASLFALNSVLDFVFAPHRSVEVETVFHTLKLIVEINGYYHFQDPMAYRRDRRKDLEPQKHGYLVIPILATDVVEHFEDVMETILVAVEFRRAAVTR
jgi:very-short-patch-repair endonuclease